MAGMMVDMAGMDTLVSLFDDLRPKFARSVQAAIRRAAKECYTDSQAIVPVGKDVMAVGYTGPGQVHVHYTHLAGTLKGSGKVEYQGDLMTLGGFWAIVSYGGPSSTGEDCDYAVYVELGTYKMAAEPYLLPSFEYARIFLMIDVQGIANLNGVV